MSDIVLSASVRQNLLSLQSTADLLSQTQERLSTGNKVNSALDNPTNFFTASSLNNRASDISNLLDGIGNGVQVLQAANTGITSLQKLVDTAKSIANQALQATSGYSTKSQFVSAAITGATSSDLVGGAASNAVDTATGVLGSIDLTSGAATNAVAAAGTAIPAVVAATSGFTVSGTYAGDEFVGDGTNNDAITIDGHTVTFDGTTDGTTAIADTTTHKYTLAEAVAKINHDLGAASSTVTAAVGTGTDAGKIVLTNSATGAASNFSVDASATTSSATGGFGSSVVTTSNGADASGGVDASGGDLSFDVNGHTVTLSSSGGVGGHYDAAAIATAINGVSGIGVNATQTGGKLTITSTGTAGASDQVQINNFSTVGFDATDLGFAGTTETDSGSAATDLTFKINSQTVTLAGGSTYTASQIKDAINTQVATSAKVAATLDTGGHLVLTSTNTAGSSDTITVGNFSSGDVSQLGFAAGATSTATGSDVAGGLDGLTLTIGSTAGGTATNITFGSGAGQVKSLDDLNTALAANNLEATLGSDGKLTITTVNDDASANIGAIGGTAVSTAGAAFASSTVANAVKDADAQNLRANLVQQYNNVITQIQTTAQDASFNGVNLLNGDQLKLVFNETGKSTLNIAGVTDDPAGLGLASLTSGTDFIDNAATNKVLDSLNTASGTLRSQASTLGSNLSIVQIRQDFSKNLINVLQTGASNLTLADTNEEAANSQALSTRQSIAVSALSLANQSQQSVLRLLQ
jgi:flagellin-like hook-associated protein FlgL